MSIAHEIDPLGLRWYALFLRSNQEKRVAAHLASRGIEHFLPCYESLRQWQDRCVKLERPLFPGYLFVHMSLSERMKAVAVPHVVALVGPAGAPSVVPDEEMFWLKRAVESQTAEPCAYLKAGQRVVITGGVLAGMEGIFVRKCNGARVVVSLESIGRSFAVEIDADALMPIDRRCIPAGYQSMQLTLTPKITASAGSPIV